MSSRAKYPCAALVADPPIDDAATMRSGFLPNRIVHIHPTRLCNLACLHCYSESDPQQSAALDPTVLCNALDVLRAEGYAAISLSGGEPLVRFRELNQILPELGKMGVTVQLVTSAVREIPKEWAQIPGLYMVVSIDGLQPEHDERRKPATYDKILRNIVGHQITVHCTITSQIANRAGYLEEFLAFWSAKQEVKRVWFSLFTPQKGAHDVEILDPETKACALNELAALRAKFPKLDLHDMVLEGYKNPPSSPDDCIFSRTTLNLTADLKSKITPCQFGGNPDCSQCGCVASAGLTAIGDYKLFGAIPLRTLYNASEQVGRTMKKLAG